MTGRTMRPHGGRRAQPALAGSAPAAARKPSALSARPAFEGMKTIMSRASAGGA